jgi:MYXO-CTERM domain-containing protein
VTDATGRQDVRAAAIRVQPDFAAKKSGCSTTAAPMLAWLAVLTLLGLWRRRTSSLNRETL